MNTQIPETHRGFSSFCPPPSVYASTPGQTIFTTSIFTFFFEEKHNMAQFIFRFSDTSNPYHGYENSHAYCQHH